MLKSLRGRYVILVDGPSSKRYTIPIVKLWDFFEKELFNIFPHALEEALHMSKEAPVIEQATAHKFSTDK
jgi:hypothetical protein